MVFKLRALGRTKRSIIQLHVWIMKRFEIDVWIVLKKYFNDRTSENG